MADSTEPPQPPNEAVRCAAAVALIDIRSGGFPIFAKLLFESILSEAVHSGNPNIACDEDFKRLRTHEAMTAMERIWLRSPQFSDEACALAGIDSGRELGPVTATMLGEMARDDLELPEILAKKMSVESFIIEHRRIVDACITFGYAVKHDVRANYKPVEGTEKLHRLMLKVYQAYMALVIARTGLDETSGVASVTKAGK